LAATAPTGNWQLQVAAPPGYRLTSVRLLRQDAEGAFYLVARLQATWSNVRPSAVAIVSFTADGAKLGQLTLEDGISGLVSQFDVSQDGTLYALWSTPQTLEVAVYAPAAWKRLSS
jgi:hypothetical protein